REGVASPEPSRPARLSAGAGRHAGHSGAGRRTPAVVHPCQLATGPGDPRAAVPCRLACLAEPQAACLGSTVRWMISASALAVWTGCASPVRATCLLLPTPPHRPRRPPARPRSLTDFLRR